MVVFFLKRLRPFFQAGPEANGVAVRCEAGATPGYVPVARALTVWSHPEGVQASIGQVEAKAHGSAREPGEILYAAPSYGMECTVGPSNQPGFHILTKVHQEGAIFVLNSESLATFFIRVHSDQLRRLVWGNLMFIRSGDREELQDPAVAVFPVALVDIDHHFLNLIPVEEFVRNRHEFPPEGYHAFIAP